ncbi:MAG: cysteine desulfurase [Bdellovibrionales bacterium]|nr:cysteine desulfurase [Bdellovibrionales bacterium]
MKKSRVYLDANATYGGLLPNYGLLPSDLEFLGNPNSQHQDGQRARALIEDARESVRALINAPHSRSSIVFTSGATESNNGALFSPFLEASEPLVPSSAVIVSSTVEHPAVLEPLKKIQKSGRDHTLVAPEPNGELSLESILSAVSESTRVVSLMLANNESGVVSNIRQISHAVKAKNPHVFFHCDGVQAVGKIPVDFQSLGIDALSISGHKFGAAPGVGALVLREESDFHPLVLGGSQEHRLRGGTENVLGIISLGRTASFLEKNFNEHFDALERGRKKLAEQLQSEIPALRFNFSGCQRLPNTLSVSFEGVYANDLVVALDLLGVSISAGSACSSGKPLGSAVLRAYGFSEEQARQTVRLSVRSDLTDDEIERAVKAFQTAVFRMRESAKRVA